MPQLQAIKLDDETTIYMEVSDDINAPAIPAVEAEKTRGSRDVQQTIQQVI